MKWRDNAMTLAVSKMKLPGDIKARQKAPHVIELAESIRRTGDRPIHLPTVEWPTLNLLAGRDRVAASLLLGHKAIDVQVVSDLTDDERRDIEVDENLHRRIDDRDALIARKVAAKAKVIEAKRKDAPADRKPGRPKTPEGEAREQVARELGTTPDAVRVAEARAAANHEHEFVAVEDDDDGVTSACSCGETRGIDPVTGKMFGDELPNKSSKTPPPVETYGLPLVTDAEADQLRAIQVAVDQADQALRRAQAALRGAEDRPLFRGVQQLIAQVHQAAAEVRRARPAAVCPYCKRLPAFVAGCTGCRMTGFIDGDAMMGVAAELRLGGDMAMVVTLGKPMVTYAHAAKATEPKAAKPKAAAKRISVVDDTGAPIPTGPPSDEIRDEDIPF